MGRSPREYIAALCYGTLYQRLAAASDLPEAIADAAGAWNDYVVILQTVAGETVRAIEVPPVDRLNIQRRILAQYAHHPLLRRGEPLASLVARQGLAPELELLVRTTPPMEAVNQARYIDRVREELGELIVVEQVPLYSSVR